MSSFGEDRPNEAKAKRGSLVAENRAPLPSQAPPAPPSPPREGEPPMPSSERTARTKRRRAGGGSLLRTAPPFRNRLRRRHRPPQGRRTSYVLLGEDRLSEAKARRGWLYWREPRPPFRHRLRRRHLPPQGRRLGSLGCEDSAIYSSTTEWGRLGGGGSQQRHPEQSDSEA